MTCCRAGSASRRAKIKRDHAIKMLVECGKASIYSSLTTVERACKAAGL